MKEFKYKINGNAYNVIIKEIEDNIANIEVNGASYKVELEKPVKQASSISVPARPQAASTPATATPTPVIPKPDLSGAGKAVVTSPLPGIILDITVNVGDQVKKGQKIVVLEAMKMENNINSDRDGKIAEIKVSKGDSVAEGAALVVIE